MAVAAAVSGTAITASGQPKAKGTPQDVEVGVTAKEIHIAVVADVQNSIVPNLFIGSRDAVRGFAKFINATGGLAGRRLVVDFYDSGLNPNATRNGEIQACSNDFAMVGTSAVFLTSVDDMRNCKDKAGQTTGIPDIPFVTTALVQQCSDQSFPMAPPQVFCNTKDQHPQTFQSNVSRGYYFLKKFGSCTGSMCSVVTRNPRVTHPSRASVVCATSVAWTRASSPTATSTAPGSRSRASTRRSSKR
jgi:hypothetical protein